MDGAATKPAFEWPDVQAWLKGVQKARDDGVVLTPAPRLRCVMQARGTSGTYLVSERGCTCPAGSRGKLCKHLSLYVYLNMERLIADYGLPTWFAQREERTA